MRNFRLFQTERVCRRQFKIWQKWQKVVQTGRKLWEKEKLLVASNFSFSHSFFKRLVSQGRQKVSLCGNGLNGLILFKNEFQPLCEHKASRTVAPLVVGQVANDLVSVGNTFLWKNVGVVLVQRLHRFCAKTLTFCNISEITKDTYLKLGICVHYPNKQYMLSRETVQNYNPFLTLTFYHLSSTPQPSFGTCMWCSCSLFSHCFQRTSFSRSWKLRLCCKGLTL